MLQNRDGGRNLFKLFGHFSIIILLLVPILSAKSFENFKQYQIKSFTNFKDSRDAEFKKYLEEEWKSYSKYKGVPLYEKAKPKDIESASLEVIKSLGPKVKLNIPKHKYVKPIQTKIKNKDINFYFYGSQLSFYVPIKIKTATFFPQNRVGIGNFFNQVASSEYEELISEVKKISGILPANASAIPGAGWVTPGLGESITPGLPVTFE